MCCYLLRLDMCSFVTCVLWVFVLISGWLASLAASVCCLGLIRLILGFVDCVVVGLVVLNICCIGLFCCQFVGCLAVVRGLLFVCCFNDCVCVFDRYCVVCVGMLFDFVGVTLL